MLSAMMRLSYQAVLFFMINKILANWKKINKFLLFSITKSFGESFRDSLLFFLLISFFNKQFISQILTYPTNIPLNRVGEFSFYFHI